MILKQNSEKNSEKETKLSPDGDAVAEEPDVSDDEDEDALDGPFEEVADGVAVVVQDDVTAGALAQF